MALRLKGLFGGSPKKATTYHLTITITITSPT
jgi:hypothetical protein